MIELLQLIDQVRSKSAQLNSQLAQKYGISGSDFPLGGLLMTNQYAVVTLELLHFYHRTWSAVSPQQVTDPDRTRQENGERVLLATKSSFILALSAFEFSAKQSIAQNPAKLSLSGGRVYLRRIIRESVAAQLIAPADEHPWEGIIEVRNMLVHNNGIAERNATYRIPNGPTITLTTGSMTRGDLKLFAESLLWAVNAFGRWCDGFLS